MAEPDGQDIEARDQLGPDELNLETPDADAAEQATPLDPAQRPAERTGRLEVDEWDALEQSRVVELDDEYR